MVVKMKDIFFGIIYVKSLRFKWIMINLYPQRATLPDNLHKKRYSDENKKNIEKIEELFQQKPLAIWAH